MKVRPRLHAEASCELREALTWYRAIDPGLARRMRKEANDAVRFVGKYPHAGSTIFGVFRHVVLKSFPYMMVYRDDKSPVEFLAVFHLRRNPEDLERLLINRALD